MQIWKPELQWRSPESLVPYARNAAVHSKEQIDDLAGLIAANGFTQPIVVDKEGVIVVGHGRREAALKLGLQEVPVVVADHLDEHQLMAYRIADNKISERRQWDAEMLKFDLGSLKLREFNMDLTAVPLPELQSLKLDADPGQGDAGSGSGSTDAGSDEVPPEPQIVRSRRGDLWSLGRHRLMCGDATSTDDVSFLMAGEKAGMVFTDPPYGMFLNADFSSMQGMGQGNTYDNVKGDHEDFTPTLIETVFKNFGYCKEIFLWGADYYAEILPDRNKGSWVVWDKMCNEEGPNDAYDKMFGSNFELCWSKTRHKRALARVLWKGIFGLSAEDTKSRVHPTQKPTALVAWFLEKFSKEDTVVVDLFGGSGSTLIACEKLGRQARLLELEPKYCDVILERWARLTGQDPVRQDGTKWSDIKR